MRFAEKIQYLRKSKRLSQEQLAEIMNVSRQAVSKWESGLSYPDIDKLVDISTYFGVSIDSLLKDTEESNGNQSKMIEDISNNQSLTDSNKSIWTFLVIVAIAINVISILTIGETQNQSEALLRIAIGVICIYICLYKLRQIYSMKK